MIRVGLQIFESFKHNACYLKTDIKSSLCHVEFLGCKNGGEKNIWGKTYRVVLAHKVLIWSVKLDKY